MSQDLLDENWRKVQSFIGTMNMRKRLQQLQCVTSQKEYASVFNEVKK